MNNISIIGRMVADPEIRTVGDGITNARFKVAVDRRAHDKNGNRQTDFLPCVAWRKTAEFVGKYFTKGQRIALEGAVQIDSYTAQDGSQRAFTYINVENVEFCESKGAPAQAPAAPAPAKAEEYQETIDDDLPF